jgi:cellulose synthase/poly-beta-1,6-N-acetylglucosamine synthase-like glycosyltransferase/peptidoglycan/xylan/chitin deacetylase (PgdA/CDA1 family)/spore germination protein YaaH
VLFRSIVIFEDKTGVRRRWASWAACVALAALTAPVIMFVLGLEISPRFPGALFQPHPHSGSLPHLPHGETASRATAPTLARDATFVFALHGDRPGAQAIDEHLDRIDVVIPDWFRLPGAGCAMDETIDDASRAWVASRRVRVLPRVANLAADAWTKDASAMLRDPAARACVAAKLAARIRELGGQGVNVDLEALAPGDSDNLVAFMHDLRAAFGEAALLTVDVTPGHPAFDLERLGAVADLVILLAYDVHEETSVPGPIASPSWFGSVVEEARDRVPADRLVVGLASYCYDWRRGASGEALTFRSAMARAAGYSALPEFRRELGGTRYSYADHEVWCADAAAVENQLAVARARGLHRWALWRAGAEDPSLWNAASARSREEKASALRVVPALDGVSMYGEGEAFAMVTTAADGTRRVTFDDDGAVGAMTYESVPTGQLFRQLGGKPREVVLTFDDGPDPVYTPRILDALRELDATATFFVLGEQALANPDLIRRIDREGHLVGNHTFRHPHIETLSHDGLLLELRSTERAIEGILGRYSPLFRAPYTATFHPEAPGQLAPHLPAFEAGYMVVAAGVDPNDWSRPGADAIADRIVSGVEEGGHIVVLHDGGGDRSQTVEAVALAVPRLRRLGYTIAPLDHHLGLSRDALAPRVEPRDEALAFGAEVLAFLSSHGTTILSALFTGCTALAALRVMMLGLLAIRRPRAVPPSAPARRPLVTVLLPAFNEDKVIGRTLRAVLASDYAELEVIVVDDGSSDETYAVARAAAQRDGRVRVIGKANGGKAAAANHGLHFARGEIVVTLDADTIITPTTVGLLARRFADPAVSAVCGNVEVGNVRSVLTAFQAIEYVTSQNLDRRALAALNAVSVVPGALGAWRTSILRSLGGYHDDTLVEDADLTVRVLRAGGRIEYERDAIGRTEAPETIAALWKQRFRWTYGTFQCLAKHWRAFFRGGIGWAGLPNMLFFQVVFPLLCPLGDLFLLFSLVTGQFRVVLAGYLGFLAMDLLGAFIAFRLDERPMRLLPLLLIQRFLYRPFMYLVCVRALMAAVWGRRHGWRKLERTGTVAVA